MALIPLNTFKTKTAVLTTLNYNQAKCSRDTGLIIDSIAYDLLFGGDTQTSFAATQYWAQGATKIPGEVFETLSALEHASEVAKKLVRNITVTPSIGNSIEQNKSNTTTTDVVVAIIDAEFELIMDIIQNGTAGTSDKIVPNMVIIAGGENTESVITKQLQTSSPTNDTFFVTPTYTRDDNQVSLYISGIRQFDIVEDTTNSVTLTGAGTSESVLVEVIYAAAGVGSIVKIDRLPTPIYTIQASEVNDPTIIINTPPYSPGKNQLRVYITGVRQYSTEYTEVDPYNKIILTNRNLQEGDQIFVEVLSLENVGPSGGYTAIINQFYNISDTTQKTFNTPYYAMGKHLLSVYVTGQRKYIGIDYIEITPTLIEFTPSYIFSPLDVILIEIISAASIVGDYSINTTTDIDIKNAAASMAANKTFLQHEIVAYVNNRFSGGYVYNPTKCARDTGLIIDSLAFDLLFSGNTQSTYAGLQYWTQFTTTQEIIPDEKLQTLAALSLAQSVIALIVLNKAITPSNGNTVTQIIDQTLVSSQESSTTLVTLMNDIINIITNGTTGTPDKIIPNGTLTVDEPLLNAYSLLQANKSFIQAEVIAWINDQIVNDILPFSAPIWPTILTNVIGDSATNTIGFDVTTNLSPGTSVIITGTGTGTLTIDGSSLSNGQTYYFGDHTTTSTATLYATLAEAIAGDTGKLDIGDGTTTGFTFTVNPNNSDSCYRDVSYIIDCISFDLVYGGNRQSTQAGAYYFGFSSTSSISADGIKITDGDFIIGNAYTIVSTSDGLGGAVTDFTQVGAKNNAIGKLFVATNTGSLITGTGTATRADEISESVSAYNYMKLLIYGIVESQPLTEIYQSKVPQVMSTDYGTLAETTEIVANIDLITNIIQQGSSVAPEPQPISLVQSSDINTQNAASLLLANKEFIKAEVIAYINDKTQNTIVKAGFFVIGTVYTIISVGNTDFTLIGSINNVEGTTFKATGSGIGTGTAIVGYTYYSPYTIVKDGSFIIGETYSIVYPGAPATVNTDSTESDFTLIGASSNAIGTTFIATGKGNIFKRGTAAVGSIVYPGKVNGDLLASNTIYDDSNFCYRDIGFIIDCIRFDLLYSEKDTINAGNFVNGTTYTISSIGTTDFTQIGATRNQKGVVFVASGAGVGSGSADITHSNRQATQAGVYYFSNSATTSVVATEKVDAINAYNYMRIVMSSVINNLPLTHRYIKQQQNSSNYLQAPYQTEVTQNTNELKPTTNLPGIEGKVTVLLDILTKTINNGPLTTPRLPITVPSSTTFNNVDYANTFNILMKNKSFIIAEVIGYMSALRSANTIRIYTAPPGVTAIVLMAQVANTTNRSIDITFSHYRNLPVFPDPSTLNGYQAPDTTTEIVKQYSIPPNDSASLIQGKMIIESLDSIVAFASESQGLKVTLSILETANA